MALPPLLQKHIEELHSQGFEIEVNEGKEICILFKNYLVPEKIWTPAKTDLLIMAHPTYPNAKLDMFWVDPPLSLKSKKSPNAVTPDTQCGKNWQRFSWHVKSWNPAHDSLITYLHTVNDRLNKDE